MLFYILLAKIPHFFVINGTKTTIFNHLQIPHQKPDLEFNYLSDLKHFIYQYFSYISLFFIGHYRRF